MSLVFIDGFDHYTAADFDGKYFSSNVAVQEVSEQRTGSGCLKFTASVGNVIVEVPAKDTYIVGFAIKTNGTTFSDEEDLITFYEDNAALESQVSVVFTGEKRFKVIRGNTVDNQAQLGITTDQFDLWDGWHYLEFKATIHDTAGSFELRFDEEVILSVTGVDTRNNNAEANEIKHIHIQTLEVVNTATFFDDLYICDTDGTKNNNFLGDCQVHTIFPIADGNEDWITSAGTDSFALVDDNPPDYDSTYVESNTTLDNDSFDMTLLSGVTDILGTQLTLYAREPAGDASLKHMVKSGGVLYYGPSVALDAAYLFYMYIWEDNPDTGSAWSLSDLNAAEFGMEVV